MDSIDQFEKMLYSVFDPKKNETFLLLCDVPHSNISDNTKWKERRELFNKWFEYFKLLEEKYGIFCKKQFFNATGLHNAPLDDLTLSKCSKANVVIALTEFSITSSLIDVVRLYPNTLRAASLPLAEKRMMDTVYSMDYSEVKKYSHTLKSYLDEAESAIIHFSSNDNITIDLRNRIGGADDGDCRFPGLFINLPSGEGFIAPYEGSDNEKKRYGKSKTSGVLPFIFENQLVKAIVKHNTIVDFDADDQIKKQLTTFFDMFSNRRNIAELGIGCNPQACVRGNYIEDEKVGVHIAYGTSNHIGGNIHSDLHYDIIYAKGRTIYADSLLLQYKDQKDIMIVKDGVLLYDLLK